MRIRTQFTLWVVGITLIPVLLVGVGWVLFTARQQQETIPLYRDLPAASGGLTDELSWEKTRKILEDRPPRSRTFVFTDSSQLIYGSVPVPQLIPGSQVSLDQMVQNLKRSSYPQDIFLFKPADSHLWIALAVDPEGTRPDFFRDILVFAGATLVIMLVFAITVAIVLGRALTLSIIRLEKAARQVAEGDLDFPITVTGSDEVRSLGVALEQMRLALRQESVRQSRFVMGVSHDLKSPLTLIKGYVELLQDGPVSGPEAKAAHFGLILDKVDQLDGMIDHLIDYSKTKQGEWQETWSEVPLKAFLEAFVQEMEPDARLLGKSFGSEISLPGGLTVTCDPRSVRRCLENLVNNALRYTPEGGRVGLSAKEIPGALEISVWDNGPGIDPQDIPHLFELFYRGTHSRREPGMGMGLSIVKTILDSHGWTIRAESNQGARFVIRIPRL